MTNPNDALLELADKGSDIDMLRQMVQFHDYNHERIKQKLYTYTTAHRELIRICGVFRRCP